MATMTRIGIGIWRWLPEWVRAALTWCLNAHFVIGTVAIIEDRDGRVLLARHTYRRRAPWALPGGWVRRGEAPADAIARELAEETGLAIEVLGPILVQRESPRHLTVIYRAFITAGATRLSAEVSEVRWIAPGTWPAGLREDHRALIERFVPRRDADGIRPSG